MTAGRRAQLSRREFLIAANAVALLAMIESCVPGASKLGATASPGGSLYERALLLLRDAVRASPDHLAFRAADIVAARDATRIVEFVHDHIAVVPPFSFLEDHRTARRWGNGATLRGGQGTLRDRAEVLADALTRAGFAAQVMSANRPDSLGVVGLYQQRSAAFAPDLKRIKAAVALLREAGAPAPASPQAFEPGPDPMAAILAALPTPLQTARPRPDLLPSQVPIVVFTQGGTKRYAFAVGDLPITDTAPPGLTNVPSADAPPNVSITVSAVSNPAPGSRTPRGRMIDLVAGRWPADVVVGRQVLLTFVPPQGPKSYLQSPLSSLPMRVPVLRVQTDTPPVSAATNLTVTGPLITVRGDVTTPAQDGPVDGPFGPIQVHSDSDRKQAQARVAAFQIAPNATAFPEVALEVNIVDTAGRSVDGLDARSFSLKEDGKPVAGFTVLSNVKTQDRPRVLVVYDTSFSVISWWPSRATKATFEENLAAMLTGIAAQASFDVQVVGTGTIPDPKGWAAPQAATIATALSAVQATDETWATIAGPALDQGVVAIIMAGDTGDEMTAPRDIPALQSRLAGSKVPVFCVPLGQPADAAVAKIVAVSGGARIAPEDLGRLSPILQPLLAKWVGGAYRLRYVATVDGPSDRTVTIGLRDRAQPVGSGAYRVPTGPLQPPSFVALYLTIEVGGLRSVRRLAGLQVTSRGFVIGNLDDAAAVAETRATLDGVTTVAIEPGTPTSAALLDDVLSSCLSIEPLRPIWQAATPDKLLQAAKNGVHRVPGIFASLLGPTKVDPAALPGLKVAIVQERASSAVLIERHADLAIGVNPVVTISTDERAGFKAAVATSVAACAAEAATFDDSAYERLSGRSLTALPAGDLGAHLAFLKTVPAERLDSWKSMASIYEDFHLVVAAAGAGDAFWAVDPVSGATKAVLLDGTGGAVIRSGCNFSATDQMALTLSMLSIMCAAAEDVFPVICLGINTADVAMTVAGLFDPSADAGTPFGAALGVFNPLGKAFGGLSATIGVALILVTIQSSCS